MKQAQEIDANERVLIVWGLGLFLIGLVQGAVVPLFENPRMGLSGHLAAVQSGMALIVFALVTSLTSWSTKFNGRLNIGLITGFYLIWTGITIAAITGASRVLPLAGHGYQSTPLIELFVAGFVITGSVLSVVTVSLLFAGVLRKRQSYE